jgi:hypothetical protein
MIDRLGPLISLHLFSSLERNQILLQQREQHDSRRLLDLVEHAVELLLATHQRIDVLDRGHVGVLGRDRARHGDQRFTGGVGDEVQVEIIVRARHRNSLYGGGADCGFLWSLTPWKGMCDTRDGTTANFLHTAARQNKFARPPPRKRDCADKSLDKLPTGRRKPLRLGDLSERLGSTQDMLMDVNKRAGSHGRNCVSPIHGHSDSNLKNLRF